MSNRALDRGAQLVYLGIEFLLPIEQLPALRLLKRGNKIRALIAPDLRKRLSYVSGDVGFFCADCAA